MTFVTFPYFFQGQVWYLIVLVPDRCALSYIYCKTFFYQNNQCMYLTTLFYFALNHVVWCLSFSHALQSSSEKVVRIVKVRHCFAFCFMVNKIMISHCTETAICTTSAYLLASSFLG